MEFVEGVSGLLYLLAAASLAARPGGRLPDRCASLLGVVGVLVLDRAFGLSLPVAALFVALWMGNELLGSPSLIATQTAAGASAALAVIGYQRAGLPLVFILPVVLGVTLITAVIAGKGALGNRRLRDEALVGLTWAGVLVAVLPELSSGWQSAVRLNRQSEQMPATAAPVWVWIFLALAAALGFLNAWWVRRR